MRTTTQKWKGAAHYDKQNRACAEIVLADVEKHGGEESALVRWARMVVGRAVAK